MNMVVWAISHGRKFENETPRRRAAGYLIGIISLYRTPVSDRQGVGNKIPGIPRLSLRIPACGRQEFG